MTARPSKSRTGSKQPSRTGIALLATYFKEQMEQTETVLVGGRRKKLSLLEITITQLLHKAIRGDERAIRDLLNLVKKAENWRKVRPKRQILVLLGADAYL